MILHVYLGKWLSQALPLVSMQQLAWGRPPHPTFRDSFVKNKQVFISLSFQEVERKHEAMLQMYGEKAEEAEELKLDIDDLKTMYRQQVRNL